MSRPARVVEVLPIGDHQLRLTFSDGLVRELDFSSYLDLSAFGALRDKDVFNSVCVDAVAGTIQWPGGIDLDPDVLHGDFVPTTGPSATLVREYRLQATS